MKILLTLFAFIACSFVFSQNCFPTPTLLDLKNIEFAEIKNCKFSLLTDKFDENDKPIFLKATVTNRWEGEICSEPDLSHLGVAPSGIIIEKNEILNTFKTKEFKSIDLIDSLYVELEGIGCANEMGICPECIKVFIRYENGAEEYFGDDYFVSNLGFPVSNFQEVKEIEVTDIECAFFTDWFIPIRMEIKFNPFLKSWGNVINKIESGCSLFSNPQELAEVSLSENGVIIETVNTNENGQFAFCVDSKKNYLIQVRYLDYEVSDSIRSMKGDCKIGSCNINIHQKIQDKLEFEIDKLQNVKVQFPIAETNIIQIQGYNLNNFNNFLSQNKVLEFDPIKNLNEVKMEGTTRLLILDQIHKSFLKQAIALNDIEVKNAIDLLNWAISVVDAIFELDNKIKIYNKLPNVEPIVFDKLQFILDIKNIITNLLEIGGFDVSNLNFLLDEYTSSKEIDNLFKLDVENKISESLTELTVQKYFIEQNAQNDLDEASSLFELNQNKMGYQGVCNSKKSEIQNEEAETNKKVEGCEKLNITAKYFSNLDAISSSLADVTLLIPGTQEFSLAFEGLSKLFSAGNFTFLTTSFILAQNRLEELPSKLTDLSTNIYYKTYYKASHYVHQITNLDEVIKNVDKYNKKLDEIVLNIESKKYQTSSLNFLELQEIEKELNYSIREVIRPIVATKMKNGINVVDSSFVSLANSTINLSPINRLSMSLFYYGLPYQSTSTNLVSNFKSLVNNVKLNNLNVITELDYLVEQTNLLPAEEYVGVSRNNIPIFLGNNQIISTGFYVKNYGKSKATNLKIKLENFLPSMLMVDTFIIYELMPDEQKYISFNLNNTYLIDSFVSYVISFAKNDFLNSVSEYGSIKLNSNTTKVNELKLNSFTFFLILAIVNLKLSVKTHMIKLIFTLYLV
ncbi:MAG: hypothetical protein IPP37_16420 [Saprospiraceae bacterium]|nr:hypothetical protein [Saprospiraceae bacterium]